MPPSADIRSLFVIRPSPARWPIAIGAGLAIGLPITILTLLGHPQLGLIASTGGFLALYISNRSRRDRARLLPLIGLGLIISSAVGVASSSSIALSLIALFALTVLPSVLLLGFGVGPPGGLFFMLVTGVCMRLTAPPALDGVGLNGWLVLGMLCIGAGIAYVVIVIPLLFPRVRASDRALGANIAPLRFEIGGDIRVIIIRLSVATAIAVTIAVPLGAHRTYWVVLTVIAILQNGRRVRLTALRAIHRVVGTFVGLGMFALLQLAHPGGLWLALLLAILQFIVELVVIRNYGLALIFITPLALLIAEQGAPGAVGSVVLTRVIDTLLGAAIALVVLAGALVIRRYMPTTHRRLTGPDRPSV